MKKKLLCILAILLLLPGVVFAKEISLKEFNYSDGKYEGFDGVTETIDGGYVAVGMTYDYPVIVKYDKNDKIEWKKYDKTYSYFYDVDVDSKGNLYVTGYTYGDNTVQFDDAVGFISKYDKDGKFLEKVLIGEDDLETRLYDLEVDDGKIVAVGFQCEDIGPRASIDMTSDDYRDYCGAYSVVLDHEFEIENDALFDYEWTEEYFGVSLTSDGGFIAVGYSKSSNIADYKAGYLDSLSIVVKFDKDYEKEWIYILPYDERLNGSNSCYYDYRSGYRDVVETCDGNFAIVGSYSELTMIEAPEEKASWKKIDEMLGESYNGLSIDYDSDEYIFYESQAAILTILDKDGNKVNEYIENNPYDDAFTDVLLLDNCSLMVTGYTGDEYYYDPGEPSNLSYGKESLGYNSSTCIEDQSDAVLRIFDKDLKVEWEKEYEGSFHETLMNISPVGGNEFVAVGYLASEDLPEVELSEYVDGLVVRLKVTYEITKNPTVNGSFDAANEHGKADVVAKGDTGIITAVPEEGYKVNSVKVVDSKGEEVPVTKVENGKYTYPIHDDTWVTVTFAKQEVAENPKTGINDFLLLGLLVLVVGGFGYNFLTKKQLFKRI